MGKKREKAWMIAPLCLIWVLWKEMNGKAFNDVERSDQAVKSFFLCSFVSWVRVYIEGHSLSLIDFIDWLFVK